MKKTLVIIFVFIYSMILAQYNTDFEHLTKDSDTVFWLNHRTQRFGFSKNKQADRSFKIQTTCFSLEISKLEDFVNGSIEFYVEEIKDFQDSSRKVFKQRINLDSRDINSIFEIIDSTEINSIPSDKFISNWYHGFDGVTYILEYESKNIHSFKKYWAPSAQNFLSEAIQIQNFIDKVNSIIEIQKLRNIFDRSIPFQNWTCNGIIVSRILTKKEWKELQRKK
ncbi:hypothetical protein [Flavobacterium silvaticum]|uniref:Uncharacterized protein n=1 Tax=Flavobacterium silvaticum TaxID=1852020 RepID=A0A972JGY4_9FLAO|nr:hypothetical protein [Flavobacterium silvaticum]NMH26548.1 hypothetical protein [Flavobacterium silvaticum]